MTAPRQAMHQRVLWLGGAQWAGKTSVAVLLAERHGVQVYHYDFHDVRGHTARAAAAPEQYPSFHRFLAMSNDERWVLPSPQQMAETALHIFDERFAMTLADLAALSAELPVIAEGWGLRPHLVAPLLTSPRQAIWLVPTEPFRRHQIKVLPRAERLLVETSDPDRAQRNRLERDRLLCRDVVASAKELGLRVVMVDGTQSVVEMADLVENHVRPFLPRRSV